MEKKRNPLVLWIIAPRRRRAGGDRDGADVCAGRRVAGDRQSDAAAFARPSRPPILVAQEQRPKKRKTLMDLLFGGDDQQQEEAPVVEEPVVRTPKAELPPAKPTIPKADGAVRLAVFGDSIAIDIAKALERFYAEDPNITIISQGVGDSGFVRTDFFDWNKTIAEQIAANSFDIAVVFIGINDRQKMRLDGVSYGSLIARMERRIPAPRRCRGERGHYSPQTRKFRR